LGQIGFLRHFAAKKVFSWQEKVSDFICGNINRNNSGTSYCIAVVAFFLSVKNNFFYALLRAAN
jgi:hypothetical protein